MIKLSVVIPSFKDPYLQKTIDSLLDSSELGDKLEVIPVLGGCWQDLRDDPRVTVVHTGTDRGMRGHINAGMSVARGEFVMRLDSHCILGKGYDRILTETCQPNWIVTAVRYFLDPIKWEVMDKPPIVYERLSIQDNIKFCGTPWRSRTRERRKIMIDETMAMQGSMWVMPRKWFNEVIGELQIDGYGTLYQDSHEVVFKTWKAGGKFMVNKNTWFAHKERSFARTHGYGGQEARDGWKYSLDTWKDYYEKEILPKWGL